MNARPLTLGARAPAGGEAVVPCRHHQAGGIAFHEGSLSQMSHGRIHLSASAARMFYNSLPVGAVVEVVH